MNKGIIALSIILAPLLISAQSTHFVCPIKKGIIVKEERGFNDGKRNPGAIIEGKNNKVYSCSSGIVNSVDSVQGGVMRIFISFDEYSFFYTNLGSVEVREGQSVMKGELIGKVKKGERLFLICSRNEMIIEPDSILKCHVITRYLD